MTTPKTTAPAQRPVRVFISYSHDSQEHSARVLSLAQRLRREGLDAIVDQFFPFPTEGWIRWMEQQVDAADFILCVCTENYRISFDGLRQGPSGKGVNWEGQTISLCIYDAGGENSRFVPVIFAEDEPAAIPRALKPYTHFVLDRQYDELYFLLTGQSAVSPEMLGPVRVRPEPLGPIEVISPGVPSASLPLEGATSIERQIQVIAAGAGKDAEAALKQLEEMARSPKGAILAETIIRQLVSYISALEASVTYPTDERLLRRNVVRTLIRITGGKLSTYLPDQALSGIDLALFDFRGADMAGVNFTGSFMIECDFREVDLSRSSFAGCHIRNVRFDGALLNAVDFSGADWFNALGLNASQLAAGQTSTLMPSPATEAEMHAYLDRSYAFPFSSWEWRVQQELRQAWATYLQPGGLAGEVARWIEPRQVPSALGGP
jgi:SEFIR domain/Pentapeptide repeats (9 copies)